MNDASTTPLFENAADSLQHGIRHYLARNLQRTAIKHAVLTIFHSIELFLKERLARVHPLLIYRNIDKPVTSDSQTVGLAEVATRMANAGTPLSATEISVLSDLQRRRNRIEHHLFEPSPDHDLVVSKALQFLFEFLPTHLNVTLESVVADPDTYREVLVAIFSYRERLERAVAEAHLAGGDMIVCPSCLSRTLVISSHRGQYCYFCREERDLVRCPQCQEYVAPDQIDPDLEVCGACLKEGLEIEW